MSVSGSSPSASKDAAKEAKELATSLFIKELKAKGPSVTIWARMHGFPAWPARFCSDAEEIGLKTVSKPKFVSVCFLGKRCEKGLVGEASITEFNQDSLKEKYTDKKYKTDADYRASIMEACRRVINTGGSFSDDIMDLVTNTSDLKWERDDICSVCCGTEFSGPSLLCEKCNIVETHFQCLRNPIFYVPRGKYYCDGCCKVLKIKPGTIVDDEEEVEEDIIPSNENFDSKIDNRNNGRGGRGGRGGGPGSRGGRGKGTPGRGGVRTTSNNNDEMQVALTSSSSSNRNSQIDDDYTAIESEENEEDEKCFVCGENGSLVLCDFPNCRRVYHHMCVLKTFPSPPGDEELINDDIWYCPKHNCAICFSLENTSCPLRSLTLPSQWSGSNSLPTQKMLTSCNSCPFSVCSECESDISNNGSLFQSKRFSADTKISATTTCLNCSSTSPYLNLAKILEGTWTLMCGSRLSLPFLHPLLPGINNNNINNINNNDNNRKRKISTISVFNDEIEDMLSLMKKIRKLEYISVAQFLSDLNILREKIILILDNFIDENQQNETSPILNAFDTIVSDGELYLKKHRSKCEMAEKLIKNLNKSNFNSSSNNKDLFYSVCDDKKSQKIEDVVDSLASVSVLSVLNLDLNIDKTAISSANEINNLNSNSNYLNSNSKNKKLIEIEMQRLWRCECERVVPKFNDKSSNNKVSNSDITYIVSERSKLSWEAFILEGKMPAHLRGEVDPYALSDGYTRQIHNKKSDISARETAKRWINSMDVTEIVDELEAARLMLGMQHTNRGETITLLEQDHNNDVNVWASLDMKLINSDKADADIDYDNIYNNNSIANDETLVILDRLRDVTSRALHLESRLRDSHLEKKKSILSTDGDEVITIGQAHVLKEMKLANDNLRWRLQQRQRGLKASQVIITGLKQALIESEDHLDKEKLNSKILKEENLIMKTENDKMRKQLDILIPDIKKIE